MTQKNKQYKRQFDSKERYRVWHDRSLYVSLGSIGLNIILAIIVAGFIVAEKPPQQVAVTDDLRVMRLPPVSEEFYSRNRIKQFVTTHIPDIISFNFNNYRKVLHGAQKIFTQKAYLEYEKAMLEKGWISTVEKNRILISSVLTSVPMIRNQYLENGRVTWEVQAKMKIAQDATTGRLREDNRIVRLLIQRCSLNENPRGIQIILFQII